MKWTWKDTAEIAHELAQQYPELSPLEIPTYKLLGLVVSLVRFGDDPKVVSPETLETIKAAWYDELQG
jgi:FeS assembly protein IscX